MKKFTLFLIVVTVIFFIFFKLDTKNEELDSDNVVKKISLQKKDVNNSAKATVNNPNGLPAAVAKLPKAQLPVRTNVPKSEEESLSYHTETLFRSVNYDSGQEDLLEELTRLDLKPTQSKTSNSLGTSNIIRTEKSLKGTRYFHAQFSGDNQGNEVLQHMSFEFKPGPDSFSKAMKIVDSKFDLPAKAKINEEGFKAWPLENGYIVWVKKLTQKDLDDNPFNAYTKEDIGTIRVAIEVDIHADGDH